MLHRATSSLLSVVLSICFSAVAEKQYQSFRQESPGPGTFSLPGQILLLIMIAVWYFVELQEQTKRT